MTTPTAPSTVSTNYLRGIAEYLVSRQCPPEPLFGAFGIAMDALSDASMRISSEEYQRLLIAAGEQTQDVAVGLHVGECIKPGQYGVLGYAVMSSKTVEEAFARHERYENLVSNRAVSSYHLRDNQVSLTWNTGDTPISHHMAEENVAAWVTYSRWITGLSISPTEIHFTHSAPDYLAEYERVFNCPVLFDQSIVALIFPRDYLSLAIVQHDPVMREMMDAHAERLLQQFIQGDGLLGRVRQVLTDALAHGDFSLERVAGQLELAPRTLQRRLSELKVSFQSVLEQTRKDLALTYILQPEIGLPEIAYLLGFSDQTAFQRSFKKWTGTTPGRYRKASIKNT